jgi:Pyoverdine/dityrosine biosynthesis protein
MSQLHPTVPSLFSAWSDRTSSLDPSKPPRSQALPPKLPASSGIAARVLALLTSSAVRKGSLEQMQLGRCFPNLLGRVERCVGADKPVQLTLMAFPFKVPNRAKVGSRRMPDLAELAALVRLDNLSQRIKSLYPPGLEFHIIHDGSYIAGVFGVTLEEVRCYEAYFARLVGEIGASEFLRLHDLEVLWSRCASAPGQWATRLGEVPLDGRLGNQEWTMRFSKTLGMINLLSLPVGEVCRLMDHASSGQLPSEYRDLERSVRVAMLRYHERDRMLHALDPRPLCFPDAIHLTTQCRPGRLAIWLVNRGNSLLPWHGVGVIRRDGKWSVTSARDLLGNPSYVPVFLEGEDTPFFYRQVADNAQVQASG